MNLSNHVATIFMEGEVWHTRLAKIELGWMRLNRRMNRPKVSGKCLARAKNHGLLAMTYEMAREGGAR